MFAKDLSASDLKEQYPQVVEFANKYHQSDLFNPLDLWTVLFLQNVRVNCVNVSVHHI